MFLAIQFSRIESDFTLNDGLQQFVGMKFVKNITYYHLNL